MNLAFSLLAGLVAANAIAQSPGLPPRAPPDISAFVTPDQLKALDEAMRPFVEQARSTYPGAKARFLAGLEKGQAFFVTTRLYDERTRSELVLLSVTKIEGDIVKGRIWSNPKVVTTYRFRDHYGFPETQLIDWLIASPDGTEVGNAFGKFNKAPR